MAVLDSPDCRVALENSLSYPGWWHLEPDEKKISYSHVQNSTWLGIVRRTGMMEGGLLLPLTFQYLILMIWRACIYICLWYLHWLQNSKSLEWPCSAVLWKLSLETWQFQALPHSCPPENCYLYTKNVSVFRIYIFMLPCW